MANNSIKHHLWILGGLLLLMWASAIVDVFILAPASGASLQIYGIEPRTMTGLRGVVFAPFLHANFTHLISNTIPFLILGGLVMLRGKQLFILVTIGCIALSGIGTWLIGSTGIHLGASGLIFGYLGFLLASAWFERSFMAIAIALPVGSLYGGLIWGVLPTQVGVSWECHLSGFIGGIIMSKILALTPIRPL